MQDVKCEAVNCENITSLEFDTPVFIYFTDQLADYHMPRLFTLEHCMDWFSHCLFVQIEIHYIYLLPLL